jgi:hypothetical protein
MHIERRGKGCFFNGYGFTTVKPYLCSKCLEWAKEIRVSTEIIIPKKHKRTDPLKITCAESKILRNMPYDQFLETPYWQAVRKLKFKQTGRKCVECESTKRIEVHHLTYKHHGREHKHLEDLEVRCRKCHGNIHNIVAE